MQSRGARVFSLIFLSFTLFVYFGRDGAFGEFYPSIDLFDTDIWWCEMEVKLMNIVCLISRDVGIALGTNVYEGVLLDSARGVL